MATGPTVRRRRLGTELRRLRDSAGYKLEEVAGMLGVAPSTLSRIETGKAPTKSAYLSHLLELYQVTDAGQQRARQRPAPGPPPVLAAGTAHPAGRRAA